LEQVVATGNELKHFVIPVFIPGVACPFQCIFCDQKKISGASGLPSREEVRDVILKHLETIPLENTHVEVGFFGGTFTGLSPAQQQRLFDVVHPFIQNGRISSIRLSTRPDFISKEILDLLKRNFVRTIELGAQSMDNAVLDASSRGHTVEDTEAASRLIMDAGFVLGLQMMIGLPSDTEEKALLTAHKIVALGASETRIYPALVIRGTKLEEHFLAGEYHPLRLEEAIQWTKNLIEVFESGSVKVLRVGLHPSSELINGGELIAGPFHPSFRELVMTEGWNDRLRSVIAGSFQDNVCIRVNPADINIAVGYFGKNKKLLEQQFRKVKFVPDPMVAETTFYVDHC
jgi:histone acetyltransferase (RNA polymerase elongator complex component)